MKTYSYNDIARYAENDMTAGERQEFEQAITADASLQQQLALYYEVHSSLQQHFNKDAGQQNLEETLQHLRGEFFKTEKTAPAKVVSINRYLKYAMGVAAILLIAIFLWKPWQKDLYEQYSGIEMVSQTERGETVDSTLQLATTAFNSNDYTTAARYLAQAKQFKPGDSFIDFYYGVALMHNGPLSQSRAILTTVFNGESVFKYEAAFYLALTYLKEKNTGACREWLEKIPADAGNYTKAQELLKKL